MSKQNDKKRLREFVDKINEAKRKGVDALVALFKICIELEDDGAWKLDGERTYEAWLREVGVDSGKYRGYRNSVDLLGETRTVEIGLPGSREIARLATLHAEPGQEKALAERIFSHATDRIGGFRVEKGHMPSDRRAKDLIGEAAKQAGISVSDPSSDEMSLREKSHRMMVALQQICELADKTEIGYKIASRALGAVGESHTDDAVEAAA